MSGEPDENLHEDAQEPETNVTCPRNGWGEETFRTQITCKGTRMERRGRTCGTEPAQTGRALVRYVTVNLARKIPQGNHRDYGSSGMNPA